MSTMIDLLKDVPLSAVLRERVTIADKENELLKAENMSLRALIQQKDQEIGTLKDLVKKFEEAHTHSLDLPTCPNCSTPLKPFYMRPASEPENRLLRQTHICPQCNFAQNQPD